MDIVEEEFLLLSNAYNTLQSQGQYVGKNKEQKTKTIYGSKAQGTKVCF